MKNWKKYLALLTALLLVLSFAACGSVDDEPSDPPAEQTEATANESAVTDVPTEEPTVEATEEMTEAAADYSAYMGLWHAGSVTLKVEKENKWTMEEDGEVFLMGSIVVNVEEGSLHLYDMEGTEAAKLSLDGADSLYAELYTEELYNRVEDFFFSREQSDVDMDEVVENFSGDDEVVSGDDQDENIGEG